MKDILVLVSVLIIVAPASGQYPFDKFNKPKFQSYEDWKVIDKPDERKIHHTLLVPNFYADSSNLTIQFTIDYTKGTSENILRIYKDKKTIQSFRNDKVDYMPNHISSHPVKVADLNGDSRLDIKITYDYNSQGLSLGYRPIYLMQNNDGTFIKYSFDNMFEGRLDFERDFDDDGVFEIQSVRLVQKNNHSYWCFQVFEVKDKKLADISTKFNYPIFIQFLDKRNYKPTIEKFEVASFTWTRDFNLIVDEGVVIK